MQQNEQRNTDLIATEPPATESADTPARARMREVFHYTFMKLKQPAIAGVWGSWDPVKGTEGVPSTEWPEFDPADVPIDRSLPVGASHEDSTNMQEPSPRNPDETRTGIAFGVLPFEESKDKTSRTVDQEIETGPGSERPGRQIAADSSSNFIQALDDVASRGP